MIQYIAIVKIKTTNILCLCSFIVCVIKLKKEKKNEKKFQPNTLTYEPTLLPIGPYALNTLKTKFKK